MSRTHAEAADLFWSKVDKSGECWLWTGSLDKNGYGHVRITPLTALAHRVAWLLSCGPIPEDLWVLHNCPGGDCKSCVNPAHLWLGTNADNIRDAMEKGRHRYITHYGEDAGLSKLTEAQAREIRRRARPGTNQFAPGNATELAREFGVTRGTIRKIARGFAWKHLA